MIKKKNLFRFLRFLKDAGFKAFAVLLMVTAGFYAYAQITWPGADPNPVSGVVGMFVGESSGAYTTAISGYSAANDECVAAYSGSHICTTAEMTNSYNHATGVSPVLTQTGVYWINSAAPGNISPAINDCNGWTNHAWSPFYGTVWNFDTDAAAIQSCGVSTLPSPLKIACCK